MPTLMGLHYIIDLNMFLQPALVFLVPSCSLSVFVAALARGELFAWFSYSEAAVEVQPKEQPAKEAVAATAEINAIDSKKDQ